MVVEKKTKPCSKPERWACRLNSNPARLRRNAKEASLFAPARALFDFNSRSSFMPANRKPSIVFVHGLWADGSCFSKLIPTLQAEGFEVIASQHGLDSHAEDVANVGRTLGRVREPAILVGHSYGGSVISAAGTDQRVGGLVYLAAFAPDDD